jgi:hypothetical protein
MIKKLQTVLLYIYFITSSPSLSFQLTVKAAAEISWGKISFSLPSKHAKKVVSAAASVKRRTSRSSCRWGASLLGCAADGGFRLGCPVTRYTLNGTLSVILLKVHKIENFFGLDLEFYTVSLLVMLKYEGFVTNNF